MRINGHRGQLCGGWRHNRIVRLDDKSVDPEGKEFGEQVANLPRTRRLWEIGGMEEGEKAARRDIKSA